MKNTKRKLNGQTKVVNLLFAPNLLQSTKNNIQTNSVTSDELLISDVEEYLE